MRSIRRRKLNAIIRGAAEAAGLPASEVIEAMAERETVLVGDYEDGHGNLCPSAALVLWNSPGADADEIVHEACATFARHFDTMIGYDPPNAYVLEIR